MPTYLNELLAIVTSVLICNTFVSDILISYTYQDINSAFNQRRQGNREVVEVVGKLVGLLSEGTKSSLNPLRPGQPVLKNHKLHVTFMYFTEGPCTLNPFLSSPLSACILV